MAATQAYPIYSFNTHNERSYTHHLHLGSPAFSDRLPVRRLPPATRRRASLRNPYFKFDPFADDPPVLAAPPPPPPPPPAPPRPNASRLVASIILNRSHNISKPMRPRIPGLTDKKGYIKSCLSSVISLDV